MENRKEIFEKLEDYFALPVASIVYDNEYDIEKVDLERLDCFFSNFKHNQAAIILHGEGGNPITATDMAITLRQQFHKKLVALVPECASSSMGYLWLISNNAFFNSNTVATQMNTFFKHNGEWISAIEGLTHPEAIVRENSKIIHDIDFKRLENILLRPDSIMGGNLPTDKSERDELLEIIFFQTCKREKHDYPLTITKLKEMNFRVEQTPRIINDLLVRYVDFAKAEILLNKKRFVIESKTDSISRYPEDSDFHISYNK
jgi:hypothetical protein